MIRRIVCLVQTASGDFLDGSNESLQEAIKAVKICYLVPITSLVIGICVYIFITLAR